MRSLKILSIGFLVSILVAASAFPVGETSPNGIEPGVKIFIDLPPGFRKKPN